MSRPTARLRRWRWLCSGTEVQLCSAAVGGDGDETTDTPERNQVDLGRSKSFYCQLSTKLGSLLGGGGVDNAQMRSGEPSGSRVKQLQDAEMVHSRAGTHLEGEENKKKQSQNINSHCGEFKDLQITICMQNLFLRLHPLPVFGPPVLHYAFR